MRNPVAGGVRLAEGSQRVSSGAVALPPPAPGAAPELERMRTAQYRAKKVPAVPMDLAVWRMKMSPAPAVPRGDTALRPAAVLRGDVEARGDMSVSRGSTGWFGAAGPSTVTVSFLCSQPSASTENLSTVETVWSF